MLSRILLFQFAFLAATLAPGQTGDCSQFNYSSTPVPWQQSDSTEHLSGDHLAYSTLYGSCSYTGNSGACNSTCSAWAGTTEGDESGKLTGVLPGWVHEVGTSSSGGSVLQGRKGNEDGRHAGLWTPACEPSFSQGHDLYGGSAVEMIGD